MHGGPAQRFGDRQAIAVEADGTGTRIDQVAWLEHADHALRVHDVGEKARAAATRRGGGTAHAAVQHVEVAGMSDAPIPDHPAPGSPVVIVVGGRLIDRRAPRTPAQRADRFGAQRRDHIAAQERVGGRKLGWWEVAMGQGLDLHLDLQGRPAFDGR